MNERTTMVYRMLLSHPADDLATLRERMGISEEELRKELDRLSELSLIRPSCQVPGRLHVVNPESGLKLLLARREAEFAAEQQMLAAARASVTGLIEDFAGRCTGGPSGDIELLDGIEEIRDRIRELCATTQHSVDAFAPGGPQTAENLRAARPQDAELLGRGVQMRTVYLDSVRNSHPSVAYAEWLTAQGGEVRTRPSLPVRMIIMDGTTAIVPRRGGDSAAGAVVLRGDGVLTALRGLFDTIWTTAIPLGDDDSRKRDEHGLTQQESAALRLLSQGHTDEVVARHLGVSPRTARRIAADLMEALGARSRFQAGVRAALRGWITDEGQTLPSRITA